MEKRQGKPGAATGRQPFYSIEFVVRVKLRATVDLQATSLDLVIG
jgi:hypothetical protein